MPKKEGIFPYRESLQSKCSQIKLKLVITQVE